MFTIYLKGVKVFAYHGVNPEENRDGQYFYLDVTAKTVTQAKELEDHLENTVSYAAINKLLLKEATENTFQLIESLASHLADKILESFLPVYWVSVTVNKPHAPMRGEFENVSVTYELQRPMEHQVYLSLGSNLGKREENLKKAEELLNGHPCIQVMSVSSYYETEPMGYLNQGAFLNCCFKILTSLSPCQLLEVTQGIEKQMKRVKVIVNGPRIIDLDILLFDQEQVKRQSLEIPHPRMMGRRFVLTPLLEIYDGEDELAEEFRRKNEALTESVELWKPRIS